MSVRIGAYIPGGGAMNRVTLAAPISFEPGIRMYIDVTAK